MPKNSRTEANGFTLIELLLVIMLIGVMAGTLISVINYSQHRKNAQDAIMRSNMQKLVDALEAYRTVEGKYPVDTNGDGTPTEDTYLANYVTGGWPNGEPVGSVYKYYVTSGRDEIGLMVTFNSGKKFKYTTLWAKPQECPASAIISDQGC